MSREKAFNIICEEIVKINMDYHCFVGDTAIALDRVSSKRGFLVLFS